MTRSTAKICDLPLARFLAFRPIASSPSLARRSPSGLEWPAAFDELRPTVSRAGVRSTRIVRNHSETFRAQATRLRDGEGLPSFVEQEFRDFLQCGWLAGGFARFRCGDCGLDRLVPFSCKGRALCPSCGGRRMAERAAHLATASVQGMSQGLGASSRRSSSAPGRPRLRRASHSNNGGCQARANGYDLHAPASSCGQGNGSGSSACVAMRCGHP